MRAVKLFAGFVLGVLALPIGAAQAAEEGVRVFGTIQSAQGKVITARNQDGSTVTFTASGRIVSNQKIGIDFLKPGLSVALDTIMQGGKMVVTHVHTQAWDRAPGTYATRPLVSDPASTRHLGKISAVHGMGGVAMMEVTHEGGKTKVMVDVPATLPILYHNREETPDKLIPGMQVLATATKGADGQLASGFVTIQVGDAKPIIIPD